eukprot:maker-scaffold156_size297567-snap-gene-0.21 protein:Tk07665 transcript:maker-scaffold156_size297567-snap-gene-0.21-mRNA-1 annotation:"hypothetical protein D910_11688"
MMNILNNRDIFPTRLSKGIFVAYMALFIAQGLLVTASRKGTDIYPYNPTTVVLLTELIKLTLATLIFLKDHSVMELLRSCYHHKTIVIPYMIPAFLYCLYNNLSFTNLAAFDPTSYFILMQIRLLLTGVVFQFLFKRKLSRIQWLSLMLVTLGCVIQKLDLQAIHHIFAVDQSTGSLLQNSSSFILILVQVSCSVFAGVYNEYLIKSVAGQEVHIMVQNVYMCLDSIISNVAFLAYQGQLSTAFNLEALVPIGQTFVVLIILNNAFIGIITSLFLKNLNSIIKAFASAIEIVFTAILSFVLLGIPIYLNTVIAVAVVSYAVVLYAQHPVKPIQSVPTDEGHTKIEMEKLLEAE